MGRGEVIYNRSHMRAHFDISRLAGWGSRWRLSPGAACLLLACLTLLAFPSVSHAYTITKVDEDETSAAIDVSPRSFTIIAEPGRTFSGELTVTNHSGRTYTFEFHMEDYQGSHDPSQIFEFLGEGDSDRGARYWLNPELTGIDLDDGEKLTMKIEGEVPDDAQSGGHYAAFISSSSPAEEESPVRNINRSLFVFRVPGATDEIGTLNFPEVPAVSLSRKVGIGLVFNNLGNIHLEPAGRVVITNFRGKTVAEIPVEKWLVMPDSSRRALVEWNSGFQFGRFTAKADIEYGSENRQLTLSRSFWVFPWQIILAMVTAVALVAYLIYSLMTRRKKEASPRPPRF